MKRIVSSFLAVAMMITLLCTTAFAQNKGDNGEDFTHSIMSAASISGAISVTIDGVAYSIPGGATSTVGYGYKNEYKYVLYCQKACNKVSKIYENDYITCPSYCGVPDGIFGPNTYDGILGFQMYVNLRAIVCSWPELAEDGVCGDNTWKMLAELSW